MAPTQAEGEEGKWPSQGCPKAKLNSQAGGLSSSLHDAVWEVHFLHKHFEV